ARSKERMSSWATPTQSTEPTRPIASAFRGPSHTPETTASAAVPAHAHHVRRRTITIVISAPMPPMYHVTYGAPAEPVPAKSVRPVGSAMASAKARAAAHVGSGTGPREPAVRGTSWSSGAVRRPPAGSTSRHSHVIRRYTTRDAIIPTGRATGSVHHRPRADR